MAELPGKEREKVIKTIQNRDHASDFELFSGRSREELLQVIDTLRIFARDPKTPHLERLRAFLLLHKLFQTHLFAADADSWQAGGVPPGDGYRARQRRDLEGAERIYYEAFRSCPRETYAALLEQIYHEWALDARQDQVEECMDRILGKPPGSLREYHLQMAAPFRAGMALWVEQGVRVEITSAVASDIFGLAMDRPEGAKVSNVAVYLRGRDGLLDAPIRVMLRRLEEPLIRLTSVDLADPPIEIRDLPALYDITRDDLGLLKMAIVAAGVVPLGLEDASLEEVLRKFGGGFELVTHVDDIPRGSGLAVSTSLLSATIIALMKFSGQLGETEELSEEDKRAVAGRALRAEWLGVSGGGWQDVGSLWPGFHNILGRLATDPESPTRGELLPDYQVLPVPPEASQVIQKSMVLAHLGLAQPAGPVLDLVTEDYYLRRHWAERLASEHLHEQQIQHLKDGDVRQLGLNETHDFAHRTAIVRLATNLFNEEVTRRLKERFEEDFYGGESTGCRGGAGHIFFVNPDRKDEFITALQEICGDLRQRYQGRLAITLPVKVYAWRVADEGAQVRFLRGKEAQTAFRAAEATRQELLSQKIALIQGATEDEVATLLAQYGFDESAFSRLQDQYQRGVISLQKGQIGGDRIRAPEPSALTFLPRPGTREHARYYEAGQTLLKSRGVTRIILNGGVGTRYMEGITKSVSPVVWFEGQWRCPLDLHLAHTRWAEREWHTQIPQILANSYATAKETERYLAEIGGPELDLNVGTYAQRIRQRLTPTIADLQTDYERRPPRRGREQEVAADLLRTFQERSRQQGEGTRYQPLGVDQGVRLAPPGHFDILSSLFLSGTLRQLVEAQCEVLFLINGDNLGATFNPVLPGLLVLEDRWMLSEVTSRGWDQGGLVGRVDGRLQIIEGLALDVETSLRAGLEFINTGNHWLRIEGLLRAFGFRHRQEFLEASPEEITAHVHQTEAAVPHYVTIKWVREQMADGRVFTLPAAQLEQIISDVTRLLPEGTWSPVVVPRRGPEGRFFPFKDLDDLLRMPEIGLEESLGGKVCWTPK